MKAGIADHVWTLWELLAMKLTPAFSTTLGAVYNADCMDLLGALKGESIDTVFADPPFNLAKDYGNGKDKDDLGNTEYLEWCYRWMDQCVRVVKPGGAIFIYNLPQWAFHLSAHLEQQKMTFRHWIAEVAAYRRDRRANALSTSIQD